MSSTIARSAALVALAAAVSLAPVPAGAIVSYGASIGAPLYSYPDSYPALSPYPVRTYATTSFYTTPFGTYPRLLRTVDPTYGVWCVGSLRAAGAASVVMLGYDGSYYTCVSPY